MTTPTPEFSLTGPWLLGNLHTHTNRSDGTASPAAMAALYRDAGYDFLALTDHDLFTEAPDADGLVMIPGVEVTAGGPHLLALGVGEPPPPNPDRQTVIDGISRAGGLAVLNHPNWEASFEHWPRSLLETVHGYCGIEILNAVVERLEGSATALDRWDRLLSLGRGCWGFATDDYHLSDDGPRNFVAVQAEPTVESILVNLADGCFYASNGLRLDRITWRHGRLTVSGPGCQAVRFVGRWGKVLATEQGATATYAAHGDEGYVRAEAYGAGLLAAYTQPVVVGP